MSEKRKLIVTDPTPKQRHLLFAFGADSYTVDGTFRMSLLVEDYNSAKTKGWLGGLIFRLRAEKDNVRLCK